MSRSCSYRRCWAAWRRSRWGRKCDPVGCGRQIQHGGLVALGKWTDSRANGRATSGSAFIQSVLGGRFRTEGMANGGQARTRDKSGARLR